MNTVSWYIYLADTLGKVQSAAGFFAIVLTFVMVGLTIARIATQGVSASKDDKDREEAQNYLPSIKWAWRWSATLWLVFSLSWGFFPKERTLYAIAASEFGEAVIKTEAVQGITNEASKALQIWIKNQIEPVLDKKDK